ncbi:uncharacterized protein PV09_08650 [Verruconis gallopava]|uniref:carnosine N-methyltransferase n=1 Tax=Verruconis gallopava TaxID=253628 RepID=A0A0D1XBW0_9PEZI|nr:uncharacterized protein PV09_08650 [Verruconis gallopava]KIV99720.1 hypothetical protein PV09_08650 [Verruconis gallopava]
MQSDGPVEGYDRTSDAEFDPLADPEERRVLYAAINSFHRYREQAHFHVTHKRRQAFYALPQKHWQLLSAPPFNLLSTLEEIDHAIEVNAKIAEAFVASGVAMYGLDEPPNEPPYSHAESEGEISHSTRADWQGPALPHDQEKAHSTVKQLYRDWSAEGAPERRACYDPVIAALDEEYKSIPRSQRGVVRVLVPGAGLGRFVYEATKAGYAVEGNEISYHQLVASNHMLNHTTHAGQYELYPWIHGFSNHVNRQDQLRSVLVPDVHPATELQRVASQSDIHPFERMSFSSADFCVAYKEADAKETFDSVASIFFIDTAPNVIKYVEAVRHCLKTGGVWINVGPLKWHFEGSAAYRNKGRGESSANKRETRGRLGNVATDEGIGDPGSVELAENEVMALLDTMGFEVERHETMQISTGYINNPNSMWQGVYYPSFWVARKRK